MVRAAQERTEFRIGAGRRVMLSLVVALLLPFYVSLPVMAFMRATSGLWLDTLGMLVLAAAFTALMALLVTQLLQAVRARIVLGEHTVRLTVPAGRSPTPLFRYRTHEVRYQDIRAVELRRELYGGPLAPIILRGGRIVARDGSWIPLGHVDDADTDPGLPVPAIASAVAARAGIVPTETAAVHRSVTRKALGLPSLPEATPVSADEIAALNARHRRLVLAVVAGLAALVALGVAMDFLEESRVAGLADVLSPR